MNDDMIERVARAMAVSDGKDPDAPAWIRYPGAETFGVCWRDQYAKKACAAIEAMREPSSEMMVVGWKEAEKRDAILGNGEVALIFRAMIDAALDSPSDGYGREPEHEGGL